MLANKKRLRLISTLLFHPKPFGVLNSQTLFNSSSVYLLHRSALWNNHQYLPRWAWWIYLVYSYACWFLFIGWKQLFKVWSNKCVEYERTENVARWQQLKGLFKLTFYYTTPPHFFYLFKLHRYDSAQWRNYLFPHELPGLHIHLSDGISEASHQLLADKFQFAKLMQKHGIPAFEGYRAGKQEKLKKEQLFQGKSLFLKPVHGSRQIHNYPLLYDAETQGYQLILSKSQSINNQNEIKDYIQNLVILQDYLIQPLYQTHKSLQKLTAVNDLITIRLISVLKNSAIHTVSAVLEIPTEQHGKSYFILPIGVSNGKVDLSLVSRFKQAQLTTLNLTAFTNYQIPYWKDVCTYAQKAHQLFPDVYSVGWDFAITSEDIQLIEGNFNWDVRQHQMQGPDLINWFV